MWNLVMFWFELRMTVSFILLITQLYYIGWITDFLHFMTVCELSRLARLPAEIEKMDFFFNDFHTCSAIAYGVQIKAPPLEVDSRWELEQIITVDAVHISFPLLDSMFLYVFSFGGLAVVHSVHFYGLRVNVEGYRDEDDALAFNVSLIGKRTKKSKTDDSLADGIEEEAINMGMETSVIIENYYGGQKLSEPTSARNKGYSVKSATRKPAEINLLPQSNQSDGFFYKISEHISILKEGAKALNDTVIESGGILNATKAKISDVYLKTKHSIEESIHDKIDALHVHLSGPEPKQVFSDFRFVCDHLFYDRVEIHMYRALPPQIRHLESKPLIVDRLEFFNLGRGSSNELIRSKNNSKRRNHSVAELSIMASAGAREQHDKPVAGNMHSVRQHANGHQRDLGSFLNIDLYEGGLDFRVFKYYFERRMLYALCKYNAGRIAYDIFFSSWHNKNSTTGEDGIEAHHPIFFED